MADIAKYICQFNARMQQWHKVIPETNTVTVNYKLGRRSASHMESGCAAMDSTYLIIWFKMYWAVWNKTKFHQFFKSKSTLWRYPLCPGRLLSGVVTFEFSWYVTVQFTDHLVDGFLPGWITIFAHRNSNVKFSERNLSNLKEPVRNLWIKRIVFKKTNPIHTVGSFCVCIVLCCRFTLFSR